MTTVPTIEQVLKLADTDPIVHRAVTMQRDGLLSIDEMLRVIVVVMAMRIAQQNEMMVKLLKEQPPPMIIIRDKVEAEAE